MANRIGKYDWDTEVIPIDDVPGGGDDLPYVYDESCFSFFRNPNTGYCVGDAGQLIDVPPPPIDNNPYGLYPDSLCPSGFRSALTGQCTGDTIPIDNIPIDELPPHPGNIFDITCFSGFRDATTGLCFGDAGGGPGNGNGYPTGGIKPPTGGPYNSNCPSGFQDASGKCISSVNGPPTTGVPALPTLPVSLDGLKTMYEQNKQLFMLAGAGLLLFFLMKK